MGRKERGTAQAKDLESELELGSPEAQAFALTTSEFFYSKKS